MTVFEFQMPRDTDEVYGDGCLDDSIGRPLTVTGYPGPGGEVTGILTATRYDHGDAWVTIEVPDNDASVLSDPNRTTGHSPAPDTDIRRTWKVHPVDGYPIVDRGPWAFEPVAGEQFLLTDGRFGYVTAVTEATVTVRPVEPTPEDRVDAITGRAYVEYPLDPDHRYLT